MVIGEWWRGQSNGVQALLRAVAIEPLTASVAQAAGEALALTGNSNAVDAIVMASAAKRGDIVYTSDLDDLCALRAVFPGVRVLHA